MSNETTICGMCEATHHGEHVFCDACRNWRSEPWARITEEDLATIAKNEAARLAAECRKHDAWAARFPEQAAAIESLAKARALGWLDEGEE